MPVIAIIAIVIIVIILNKTGCPTASRPDTCHRCRTTDGRWRSRCCQCRADAVRRRAGGYFVGIYVFAKVVRLISGKNNET